jgi:plastocyanin
MTARMFRGTAARLASLVLLGLVALMLVAPGAGAKTTKITVNDNYFKPRRVKVVVGSRVTWKWKGVVAHNVTVEKGPQKFHSKTQTDGKFSRRIRKPGTYKIVCTIHPGMDMTLKAINAPEPTTTPSSTPPSSTPPGS